MSNTRNIRLTAKPFDFEKEKNMFGRSRLCEMLTGHLRCNDSSMALATGGGADADNAIKGTSVSALRPPILLKDVRKSEPLNINTSCTTNYRALAISYHSGIQCASSTATKERCFLKKEDRKMFFHG